VRPLVRRSARVQLREWALLTLLLCALLVAATKWGWLERADFWLYDASVTLAGRAASPDILILTIDETSVARLGRWPWSRQVLAEVVERLTQAGAGPVLLDIILSEPQRDDPLADARLAAAIAAHGRVVLPVFMPLAGDAVVRPLPALAARARLGHAQALVDADGVTRRYLRVESTGGASTTAGASSAGESSFAHVAQILAELAGRPVMPVPKTMATPPGAAMPTPAPQLAEPLLAPFAGPPGHFARRPVLDLLDGRLAATELKGRTVLVGATATGLGDNLVTPLAGLGGTMPGIEFVANVLDGLMTGTTLQPLGSSASLGVSVAVLLALMMALLVTSPQAALWITVLSCAGLAVAAGTALKVWGVWFPPAAAITVMAVAYPLWSWRRLEASLSAMTRETRRIAALAQPQAQTQVQPGAAALPTPKPKPLGFFDPVETRIAAITHAVDQIAGALATDGNAPEARQHREDMMRHLAHDLRSPLVSLRSLADSLRSESPSEHAAMLNRIDACARRALDLSEQFLLMGRAESLDPASFTEVDLVQVLHQSADDLWEDARSQGARIERRCTMDCALVQGDARLLHRALLNLGWNGLRHGLAGGTVTLSLHATPTAYVLAVHDQGTGFALEALAHLSQRYTQAATPSVGHGLGLALARLVASKHQATLTAEHPPGGGFTVALSLPRQ
jgi:CHASE2 domain-containing sensor protein